MNDFVVIKSCFVEFLHTIKYSEKFNSESDLNFGFYAQ